MEKDAELNRPLVASESDDDTSSINETIRHQQRSPRTSRTWRLTAAALIPIFLVAVFLTGVWAGRQVDFEQRCAKHTSQWSPFLRDTGVKYRATKFEGKFHDQEIYRQAPSPEVDAAWEALGVDYRAGAISYEDGLASGLEPSFVQRSEAYGGGFMVNVEGMHHLHCLNLVRKSLYFNHGYYEALGTNEFLNNGTMLEHHITHCLDTVRQVLMCNVDTGVLGQRWVDKDKPYGFPDFQTTHTCKNYEDVRKWAEKLQAPPFEELPADYLASPGPGDVLETPP
ncbi:tat pathway signal sequence [Sarocladium implicatum]|nr:tat pathway signal sequence [Sarocladium implicatum]